MSPIGIVLDLVLAGLLLGALFFGMRLNARLKSLRDSQAGFAAAALELNQAMARAEAGLSEMRAATRQAEDGLMERVDEARLILKRLNESMEKARTLPRAIEERAPVMTAPAERDDLAGGVVRLHDRAPEAAPALRSRARVDDDLFAEDESIPQILERIRAGARR